MCERRRGRRRGAREGACTGAATMPHPWTLRLILNDAALAASSPTLLFIDVTLRHELHSCAKLVITEWEALTPRRQRRTGRRQGEARQLPTRLHRAPLFLLAGRLDDLRENHRGLPPPALDTVSPSEGGAWHQCRSFVFTHSQRRKRNIMEPYVHDKSIIFFIKGRYPKGV